MSESETWPDEAAWRSTLIESIRQRARTYEAEPDVHLRRNKAIAMVAALTTYLKAVPGIRDSDLYPLKDLLIFSEDLDHGRSHPWAKPVNIGGTNYESAAETEFRAWVVLASVVLNEAQVNAKKADLKVSELISKSGRAVPWRTVQRWRLQYKRGDDPRLAVVPKLRNKYWTSLPCRHGGLLTACPASEGEKCADLPNVAERFAAWSITAPAFRDRFIS